MIPAVRKVRRAAGTASLALQLSAKLSLSKADLAGRAQLLGEHCARLLHLYDIEVEELGERPTGGALIVSNHVNYLDPLVVFARYPAVAVAKAEVKRWPVFGPLAIKAGIQFVERKNARSRAETLHEMERTLRSGVSVLNFAEGTTSDGTQVLPLRPGSFRAARAAGVPIVPVALQWESTDLAWTGDATFFPHWLYVQGRAKTGVRLTWGEPLVAQPSNTDAWLARRAHDFISSCIEGKRHVAAACA